MVWSIFIFLIILVVLKGIFNTTIRDNPNSGYNETQNRLKNIIEIQKGSGVYVGISEIDHMAHGIFFLRNEVGYIRRGSWPRQNNNGLLEDIVGTVNKNRLEISTFGKLEKYPLATCIRDKNMFSFTIEVDNSEPGDEYLEVVNTTHLHFEMEILAPSILKVSIEQVYFNANTNQQHKKQLCVGTILEYQDKFTNVVDGNISKGGSETLDFATQTENQQEVNNITTFQNDIGVYIGILDGINRRPVGMYFTYDQIYFIEGPLDFETSDDILAEEMCNSLEWRKNDLSEHGYFEVNGEYKYEYFSSLWPVDYSDSFGIRIDTLDFDNLNNVSDVLEYYSYDFNIDIVDKFTLQLNIEKATYTEPFSSDRFSKSFIAEEKIFNFHKFI